MCGIGAVIHKFKNVNNILYEMMFNLQHRGQDSSGFVCYDSYNQKMYQARSFGLVDKNLENIVNFKGNMGLGHVRYPTQGLITKNEIQPFTTDSFSGISLVHNGNITNSPDIYNILYNNGIRCVSTSDSEFMLKLFIFFLTQEIKNTHELTNKIIGKIIKKLIFVCKGSYSVVIMINNFGLIVFRDIYGIRPLVYSYNKDCAEISSETIGLTNDKYCNIDNGEVVMFKGGNDIYIYKEKIHDYSLKPCVFEYIYFARPESYINDILVYEYREKIAEKIISLIQKSKIDINSIDCIVPIPQTGLISAICVGQLLNKPIKNAVIKNRYTYRTFINKDKDSIVKGIKKIKIIKKLVEGKNILIVDDSIVRGNTSKHIISELKKANVNKIYMASCCPPIRYPNKYGIAIPTHNELIAHNKTEEQIKTELGLNELIYLDLESLCDTLTELNPKIKDFEVSVFNGKYISNEQIM